MLDKPARFDPARTTDSWRDTSHSISAAQYWRDKRPVELLANKFIANSFYRELIKSSIDSWQALDVVEWFDCKARVTDLNDPKSYRMLVDDLRKVVLRNFSEHANQILPVVEGQHRLFATLEHTEWVLSRRVAEQTFDALRALFASDREVTSGDFLLTVKVILYEAWTEVRSVGAPFDPRPGIPSTREWAHDYFIHTGSSPPLNQAANLADLDRVVQPECCLRADQIDHLNDLAPRGQHDSNRRSGPRANYANVRELRNSQGNCGWCTLEGEPATCLSQLVNHWQIHGRRQAVAWQIRRPNRRALGDHIRMGLRRQPRISSAA